MLILSIF